MIGLTSRGCPGRARVHTVRKKTRPPLPLLHHRNRNTRVTAIARQSSAKASDGNRGSQPTLTCTADTRRSEHHLRHQAVPICA
jgi:hypothetical protein